MSQTSRHETHNSGSLREALLSQPLTRRLLTVPEVAELTRWSRSFVYQLVTSGKLRAVRAGRTVPVDRADLDAFIEASKVGTTR